MQNQVELTVPGAGFTISFKNLTPKKEKENYKSLTTADQRPPNCKVLTFSGCIIWHSHDLSVDLFVQIFLKVIEA